MGQAAASKAQVGDGKKRKFANVGLIKGLTHIKY